MTLKEKYAEMFADSSDGEKEAEKLFCKGWDLGIEYARLAFRRMCPSWYTCADRVDDMMCEKECNWVRQFNNILKEK